MEVITWVFLAIFFGFRLKISLIVYLKLGNKVSERQIEIGGGSTYFIRPPGAVVFPAYSAEGS